MENLHKGHRSRMKKRFRSSGLEDFADHEVIELLLYFGISVKNTNELAHTLMNKFGSLSAVFDSSYEELLKIDGIKEHTATLITMIPALAKRYSLDKVVKKSVYFCAEDCAEMAVTHFIGATKEHVEVFLFDCAGHLINHATLHKGSLTATAINLELLGEFVFENKAASFLICHNHPSGELEPSKEDIIVTREIYSRFKALKKNMIGHILVCGSEYMDILDII